MQLFANPVAAAAGTLLLAFAALHVAGTPLPASAAAAGGEATRITAQDVQKIHAKYEKCMDDLGRTRDLCERLRANDVRWAKIRTLEVQMERERRRARGRERAASNTQAFITHQVAKAGHGLQNAMVRVAPLLRKAEGSAAAVEKWALAHGE
ncbi:MAG: hypothetical protein M1826_006688 [Phylliscum demangeonii]|nr:MAG: hypothetical protein M1826_006688 [Phylliscum demangeonii]